MAVHAYNRGNRCPICGKPDWCGYYSDEYGFTRIVEKRSEFVANCAKTGDTVQGADGGIYYYVCTSKGENKIFMSRQDWDAWQPIRQREYEQWCSQNGILHPNKHKYVSTPISDTVPMQVVTKRKEPVEVDRVDPLPNGELNKVFRAMVDAMILEDRHRDYLKGEGWTDEMIDFYQIKSFPERDKSRMSFRPRESRNVWRKRLAAMAMNGAGRSDLRGVPGAYQDQKGEWTFTGNGGLFFPLPDINGNLYRGRIRMDFRDPSAMICRDSVGEYFVENDQKVYMSMKGFYTLNPDGSKEFRKGGGKYRNLSSFLEDEVALKQGIIRNRYPNGCRSGNALGFYFGKSHRANFVYVTEGEKKAAFAAYEMDALVISVPGVDSWPLLFKAGEDGKSPIDVLKEMGTRAFIVAYDADKSTNATVLMRQQETARALADAGFIIGIAEWDAKYGKGLDDLLANGCAPSYVPYSIR